MHGTDPCGYLSNEFLRRIQRAYRLALARNEGYVGFIWTEIGRRQKHVSDALIASDSEKLRSIFADPYSSDLYYGVDNACLSLSGAISGNKADQNIRALLIQVARELQVGSDEPEDALQALDRRLNQHIDFPAIAPRQDGFETSRGLATYRALQAVYQTARILDALARLADRSVLEIGPGAGRTAYYAYRAGITDYTTIDLPLGMVAQARFLALALGPDKIWLPGDDEHLAQNRIKLLPSGAGFSRRFGVAFNSDSLPEMTPRISFDYATKIRGHADTFLSVNHEKLSVRIADLAKYAIGAQPIARRAYPIRSAYVEELYRPGKRLPLLSYPRFRATVAWRFACRAARAPKKALAQRLWTR